MDITDTTGMADAFHAGVTAYTPSYRGIDLEPENGDPFVTLRNIGYLLGQGLTFDPHQPISISGLNRVLVRFASGERYLAIGFDTGVVNAGSLELVKLAVLAKLGTEADCLQWIAHDFLPGPWRIGPNPNNIPDVMPLEVPQSIQTLKVVRFTEK